jgi:hypothetical protein
MDVTVSLDGVLSDGQRQEIERLLAPLTTNPLEAFCKAAIADSADAIIGRRPESALTTQYRLYRLIKHGLNGAIPSEATISNLLGITERRALSIISTVIKRYSSELRPGLIAAVQLAFSSKESTKDDQGELYQFNAPQGVIDYLRELIAGLASGKLVPIQRVKATADRYEIRKDTHDKVIDNLGLVSKKKPK